MDYAKDWGQSLLGGPRRGLESIPGTGGDAYDFLASAHGLLRKWAGDDPQKLAELQQYYQDNRLDPPLPNSPEIEAATEPYIGEHYQPKTTGGRILSNIGAAVTGGGGRHLIRDFVAPAIGAEAGGQAGEYLGGDAGKLFGTILGGGTGGSGQELAKRMMYRPVTPERRRMIQTLQTEEVPITGGQAYDSNRMQLAETGPYANKAAGIADEQTRAYTRAAFRRAGIDAEVGDDRTLVAAQQNFGQEYENLVRANNGVPFDPDLQNQLTDIGARYGRLKGTTQDAVGHYFDRIVNAATQRGGVIPPRVFQEIHSEIAADLRAAKNSPELSAMRTSLREFQDALYDAIGRNGQPDVVEAARDLNRRYRNFKIVEKALYTGSTDAAQGFVTPAKLSEAVRQSESSADFTQNRGEFDELVKAGTILKPLPNTQSGARGMDILGGGAVATGLGMMLGGDVRGGAAAAAGGVAAPFMSGIPSAIRTARPVRTSVVSRAAGDAPNMWTPLPMAAVSAPLWRAGSDDGMSPATVEMMPDEPYAPEEEQPVPVDESALNPKLVDPRDILRRRGLNYG
jgi:hypothetical protein